MKKLVFELEVGTALWSHVRVVVVGDPPPLPTLAERPTRLSAPHTGQTPQARPPPLAGRAYPRHVPISGDGREGALGLYADEAYLLFR